MKKILISLSIIGIAAAVVVGGTIAFFNDTETSTGNIFTAGSIDLTVDNYSYYNGELVESWGMTDLTDEKFFDLGDIKPGDWGQFRISVHIDDNPAWMCLIVDNKHDDDNGLIDPEEEAGDTTGGPGEGELSESIDVFVWRENDGDGVYEPDDGETAVIETELVSMNLVGIADSLTGTGPIMPGLTNWLGMQWCAGTQTVDYGTGTISCDGSSMGDKAQTDSFTADLSLYIEQHRNNPDFTCTPVGSAPDENCFWYGGKWVCVQ